MSSADDWQAQLAAFGAELEGPLGRRKLQAVFAKHHQTFARLRDDGASWRQIAAALAKQGVRREDGSTIPADQLRAMASRCRAPGQEAISTASIALQSSPSSMGQPPASDPAELKDHPAQVTGQALAHPDINKTRKSPSRPLGSIFARLESASRLRSIESEPE